MPAICDWISILPTTATTGFVRRFFFSTLFVSLAIFADFAYAQSPTLQVVYPVEGQTITALDSVFVYGNVSPPSARVVIDGITARKYANGTFLTMIPTKPGRFEIQCLGIADSGIIELVRTIEAPPYLVAWPTDHLGFDSSYVYPRAPLDVQSGDRLTFFVKGTPNCTAYFSIAGVAYDVPMQEQKIEKAVGWSEAFFGVGRPPMLTNVAGIYRGSYIVQPNDREGTTLVQFQLISPQNEVMTMLAPGQLTILDAGIPRVGIVQQEVTLGRTGSTRGSLLVLPSESKLWITGRDGDTYRGRLSETEDIWVPASAVRLLPKGTVPAESEVVVARTETLPDRARVRLYLQERLPFRVSQGSAPQTLTITLFGAGSTTEWIRHDYDDPLLEEIRWRQLGNGVSQLVIALNQRQQWGYSAYYSGVDLIIEIRKNPPIAGWPSSPLRDLLICIDPGHAPDLGAQGPTGLAEKDATLQYALALQKLLEKKGAQVVLTREGDNGVNLASRTKIAEALDADIFVSIHFNSLPEGVNPFAIKGTSTYYYHMQSYPLAKAVQKRLLVKTHLPDHGLYYDNFAVCRITSMPAILVEPAFIMHPLEERRILDEGFRERVCEGIVEGLEDFVKAARD